MKLSFLQPSYKFFRRQQGRKLEIEISTNCVASCSECPRTRAKSNGDEGWDVGFLDPDILMDFLKRQNDLNEVVFCGSYGDAIYHPQLAEICRRLNTELGHKIRFTLETAGSHRSQEWWTQLAKHLTSRNSVTFSIDGLEDTNAIYRVGTRWESIITGIETLRENFDGQLVWKWIVFRHNEHQVEEAYRLSKKLKMNKFLLVNSGRHYEGSKPTQSIFKLEENLRRTFGESALSAKRLQPSSWR